MTIDPASTPMILTPEGWHDVHLLDSGHGRKLEQVGPYRFIRPEMQAIWPPALDEREWQKADGEFIASAANKTSDDEGGKWKLSPNLPPQWPVQYDGISFTAMPTPFRHLGFFPEQSAHWQWCAERCRDFSRQHGRPPKILNLFGYTGVASLHAAHNGAEVTHVDSSKKAIAQPLKTAIRQVLMMRRSVLSPKMPAVLSNERSGANGSMMASSSIRLNMAAA